MDCRSHCATLRSSALQSPRAEKLVSTEEHLRVAAEAAQIGTWEVDPQAGARYWSSQFRAILGVSEDTVADDQLFSSLIDKRPRSHQGHVSARLRGRKWRKLRRGVSHTQGRRWLAALGFSTWARVFRRAGSPRGASAHCTTSAIGRTPKEHSRRVRSGFVLPQKPSKAALRTTT